MFLWCSNISVGSGTLGNLLDGFLQSFMPPRRSGLDSLYMRSNQTESSGFIGQLRIIHSCK